MSKKLNIQKSTTTTNLVSNLKIKLAELEVNSEDVAEILAKLTDVSYALDYFSIVAITDYKGTIISVNDTFCEISKYSRKELIGKNHSILNSGHHTDEFFRQMWKTISKGDIWNGELKNRAKDGTYYWLKTIIFPVLDDTGKPYEFIAVRTDITAGKLYENQLREVLKNEFGQVMRSLDNFVFKLKKCHKNGMYFTLIAGKLAKELGLHDSEHLIKSINRILPKKILKKILKPVEDTFNGTTNRFELKFKQKHLFVTLSPFFVVKALMRSLDQSVT